MRTTARLVLLLVLALLATPLIAQAQTPVATINLGKPTPNSNGNIYVNVNTQVLPLPPSSVSCTASLGSVISPGDTLVGSGYNAGFRASTDHAATGQGGAALVTFYELQIFAPTASQPCYTGQVWSVNATNRSESAALSGPFPLALARPAAPQGSVVISKP
jgi:hypothetical protein